MTHSGDRKASGKRLGQAACLGNHVQEQLAGDPFFDMSIA